MPIQIYILIYKLAYTFFKIVVANLCNLRFFFANIFVCTVMTDLFTRFC